MLVRSVAHHVEVIILDSKQQKLYNIVRNYIQKRYIGHGPYSSLIPGAIGYWEWLSSLGGFLTVRHGYIYGAMSHSEIVNS
jgi:hypothetical protein